MEISCDTDLPKLRSAGATAVRNMMIFMADFGLPTFPIMEHMTVSLNVLCFLVLKVSFLVLFIFVFIGHYNLQTPVIRSKRKVEQIDEGN